MVSEWGIVSASRARATACRAGAASFAAHDQGGRIDLAVVCESAVEAPDFVVLADRLGHERQVLPKLGPGNRVLQDDPEKPAGHASRLVRG